MNNNLVLDTNSFRQIFYYMCLICSVLFCYNTALASAVEGSGDPIGESLCNVIETLQGTTAKAVAIVAIIACAFMFLTGNMKWPTLLMIACGIIIIFGASSVVDMISGGTEACGQA